MGVGVLLTSDGRRTKIIGRTQIWAWSFHGHKTGVLKHRIAFSFRIGLCSDLHLWSWNLGNDLTYAILSASDGDTIFVKNLLPDVELLRIKISQPHRFSRLTIVPQRLMRRVMLATSIEIGPRGRPRTGWREIHLRPGLAAPSCGANKTFRSVFFSAETFRSFARNTCHFFAFGYIAWREKAFKTIRSMDDKIVLDNRELFRYLLRLLFSRPERIIGGENKNF